jgi:hypothetical protein
MSILAPSKNTQKSSHSKQNGNSFFKRTEAFETNEELTISERNKLSTGMFLLQEKTPEKGQTPIIIPTEDIDTISEKSITLKNGTILSLYDIRNKYVFIKSNNPPVNYGPPSTRPPPPPVAVKPSKRILTLIGGKSSKYKSRKTRKTRKHHRK